MVGSRASDDGYFIYAVLWRVCYVAPLVQTYVGEGRVKIISQLVAIVIACQGSISFAEDSSAFMISGMLRKGTDGVVIKLVQGVEPARSSNEAVGAFTRKVLAQYPGYSLVDAIAMPVPSREQPCRRLESI